MQQVSLETYQSLFETSIDGIVIINDQGLIQDLNKAALVLFEYEESELVGRNVSVLMGEPHRSAHDSYLHRYQETKEPRIIGIGREVEGRKKDGTLFPLRLAVSAFQSGSRTFYTGILHDLTTEHAIRAQLHEYASKLELKVKARTSLLESEIGLREQTQRELLESQKLYEAIAVNFPNGTIGVLDQELNILFMEGTELKSLGYGSQRLLGKNYIELLPEDVRDEVQEQLMLVLAGENREFEIVTGDKIYLGRSVPLPNENGEIDKILQVDTNITSEKQAEEEIYNALMKEKQLNELKSSFVQMASHEFRTPLSSIQSSATLIKKYTETEQQGNRERHIDKIISNVKNLNMILNDFLSLEKIEAGLIKNQPQIIHLTDFLNEILEETSPLMKAEQQVIKDFNHKIDVIELDPFLLRNVLNNLLSNAFKYSHADGQIVFSSEDRDGLSLKVKDSGIGISEDDQAQLFSRFFRASNATNIQGTGLGLNIVRRYAKLMHAEITFESELNVGSTFTIQFKRYE